MSLGEDFLKRGQLKIPHYGKHWKWLVYSHHLLPRPPPAQWLTGSVFAVTDPLSARTAPRYSLPGASGDFLLSCQKEQTPALPLSLLPAVDTDLMSEAAAAILAPGLQRQKKHQQNRKDASLNATEPLTQYRMSTSRSLVTWFKEQANKSYMLSSLVPR